MSSGKPCYLCRGKATTKDHVPPKCFFPVPRPNNLIAVPACKKCNHSWSGIDSAFRDFVICHADNNAAAKQVIAKVFSPNNTCHRSFRDLASSIRDVKVKTTLGNSIAMPVLSFDSKNGDAFLARITKGLLYKYRRDMWDKGPGDFYAAALSGPNSLEMSRIPNLKPLVTSLQYHVLGDGVFRFGNVTPSDSNRMSIWVYWFYDAAPFIVYHAVDSLGLPRTT